MLGFLQGACLHVGSTSMNAERSGGVCNALRWVDCSCCCLVAQSCLTLCDLMDLQDAAGQKLRGRQNLRTSVSGKERRQRIIQLISRVRLFTAPWTTARQASLSFTISRSLLKLISIMWVMPPNHLILCRPLLLLPSIFPSLRVFSSESGLCIKWSKC